MLEDQDRLRLSPQDPPARQVCGICSGRGGWWRNGGGAGLTREDPHADLIRQKGQEHAKRHRADEAGESAVSLC